MPPPMHFHMHHHRRQNWGEEKEQKPHVGSTYLRLLRYAKPYWWRVLLVLAISLVSALISTLPAQVIGVAVDEMRIAGTPPAPSPAPSDTPTQAEPRKARRNVPELPIAKPIRDLASSVHERWWPQRRKAVVTFVTLGLVFLCLHTIGGLISVAQQFIMAFVGQRLIYDMRNQVYSHLQRLSLTYFDNQRTGDVMSRVVNDVNSLDHVIVGPVVSLITDLFRLGWILYFCLTWDWKLTVLALLAGPLLVSCTYVFGRFIRKNFREQRTRVGELNAIANDNISGIRIIQGFSREDHEERRFRDKNFAVFGQNLKLARMFAAFRPFIELITNAGSAVVLCYGGYKVINGEMNPGTFVVFFPYLGMLYGPITGFTRFWNFIQRAVASVERVFEVLDTAPDIKDAPDAIDLPATEGRVEFRNVHFSYDRDVEVLSDLNLAAQPGQMIAFVGPSGAGKSTLTNLILRFYDPAKGEILVDGHPLRSVKVRALRQHMAMVLQESFLFNDTVKANIAYGKVGATDEEIVEAAKAANAHEFIAELPDQYDTVVGERGVKLSGGQKQRVSIARAILANPRILILDEATSSVDTETEVLIQDAIYRLVENRTTFIIAHRLSTILHADLIVVMDKGRIVETGTHEELLAQGNLYCRLFEMQFRDSSDRRPGPDYEPPESELDDLGYGRQNGLGTGPDDC